MSRRDPTGGPGSLCERPSDGTQRTSSHVSLKRALRPDHIDIMYRAAYALCGSRHDAEDLVQETFARVLKRERLVRRGHELGYLVRALRNTHYSRHRAAARRPASVTLTDDVARSDPEPTVRATEIMEAIASAPPAFRDAVIAVDLVGLSYREASRALRAREATITSRLYRGRQHVARALSAS